MTAPLADRIRAVLALADAATPDLACRQLTSLRSEGNVFSVYGIDTGRIVAEVSGPKAAQDAELFANTGEIHKAVVWV